MIHQPETRIRPGSKVTACCPCGWAVPAASHDHSVALGAEHLADIAQKEAAMAKEKNNRLDPDCVAGKHPACQGWAWDDEDDVPCRCECPCHEEDAA